MEIKASEIYHQGCSITDTDNCSINLFLQLGEESKHRTIDFKGKYQSWIKVFLLVTTPLMRKRTAHVN